MSSFSPNRRGSVISNCTNDSDIASDKTPISGQPKKLRKQINNDNFKQNYFELSLSTSSGVQVLAFQPGNESTPKKRKRNSTSAASRRKSVSSVAAAEEDSNNDSPQIQTKQKKRKQSIANSVDTPSEELFSDEIAIDQSILNSISCDKEVIEFFQQQQQVDETPRRKDSFDNLFMPVGEFKFDMKKGRNLACSTTNIQTTSSCSYSLKNSPETPNLVRNRSASNSHPNILNQTNSNTIRKRSDSCVSLGQVSNSQSTSCAPTNCIVSPPERLMAKEMKLNVYLNMKREAENCGNSQNSPMILSSESGMSSPVPSQQDSVLSTALHSVSNNPFQRLDSNNSFNNYYNDSHNIHVFPTPTNTTTVHTTPSWEEMNLSNHQSNSYHQQLVQNSLMTDLLCKQMFNSIIQEQQLRAYQSGGLDPALFEALFNNIQETITDSHQETFNIQNSTITTNDSNNLSNSSETSPNLPELTLEALQSMDVNQIQTLIDYLERLHTSKSENNTPQSSRVQNEENPINFMIADEFQNDEFMF